MRPISVFIPVAVTTARPVPRVTPVPLNTMSVRSASAAGSRKVVGSLSTGSLSPVSDASATESDAARTSRPSAPTASPSCNTITSPGTSSAAGTPRCRPSRTTVAVGAAIRCSAATASSAFRSCTKPRMPLATTMTAMTIVSNGTSSAPSTSHAAKETTTAARSR